MHGFKRYIRNDKGSSAIQYALVAGLVAVVLAGALSYVGPTLRTEYQTIADALDRARGKVVEVENDVVTGSVSQKRH